MTTPLDLSVAMHPKQARLDSCTPGENIMENLFFVITLIPIVYIVIKFF